jgi:hypothetical protein
MFSVSVLHSVTINVLVQFSAFFLWVLLVNFLACTRFLCCLSLGHHSTLLHQVCDAGIVISYPTDWFQVVRSVML